MQTTAAAALVVIATGCTSPVASGTVVRTDGNLCKPIGFDLGQAVDGATNVVSTPASKGCPRLSVANQQRLLARLDTASEMWSRSAINLTVTLQSEFAGR